MVAISVSNFTEVRQAREYVRDLAQAAGIQDTGAAVLATGELGNNCVEHGDRSAGLLYVDCAPGRLSLRFENACERRPDWLTRKPRVVEEFRAGGYGLSLVRALASGVDCCWDDGRVVVLAEFH